MEHIRLVTVQMHPWTSAIRRNGNDVKVDGVINTIFDVMAQSANFTYNIFSDVELAWGNYYSNGTWTGAAGMVQQKKRDMLFPWAQGEHLQVGLQPSKTIFTTTVRILASAGKMDAGSLAGFLTTFDVEIWYSLLGLVALTILVASYSDVLLAYKKVTWKPLKKEISRYFWCYVSALFYEGTPKLPESEQSRFLLGIWLLAMLTMMNAFCGQFKAMIMIVKEEPRIRSVKDLGLRRHIKPVLPLETLIKDSFMNSEMEDYKRVWQNVLKYGDESLVHNKMFFNISSYQRVKSGEAVLIYEQEAMKGTLVRGCNSLAGRRALYMVEEELYPMQINIAIRKDIPKPWLLKFNTRIQWMVERGVILKFIEDSSWNYSKCEIASDDNSNAGLKLDNLLPIFYFVLMIDALCFFTLFGEIIKDKWNSWN